MQKIIFFYLEKLTYNIKNWLLDFFSFYIFQAPLNFWKKAFSINLFFEDFWAVIINIKYFFTPLYQDYSLAGKILAPFLRLFRITIGIAIQLILFTLEITAFFIFIFFFWGAWVFIILNLIN